MDYIAVFQACTKPWPTYRMREGGSFSGTMGQTRQRSAQLCKINQLLTRLGPLFAWPRRVRACIVALQPHTFQRCKQWGAGCRVLALAHSCEERRGCGKDLEVGSADSSSCLILGTVSICAGGLGSAWTEYRRWLPWLLNCFDCAHANACSIRN